MTDELGHGGGATAGGIQFYPIAIGVYQHHDDLPADREAQRIAEILAPFGAWSVPWGVDPELRGADAVEKRLAGWASSADAGHSVLYWVGHGTSTGDTAHLAHAFSPVNSGMGPAQLAEAIRRHQGWTESDDNWTIAVVDACRSDRFVQLLAAQLAADVHPPRRLLLVGTSASGAVTLGTFTRVLRRLVANTFHGDREIELWDLARELDRNLPGGEIVPRGIGGAVLRRQSPVSAALTAPLDIVADVEAILAKLSVDERRHFVPKAQGGELGEVTWYFEGRRHERALIVDWLRTHDTGMLVLTGAPGSGKSAILGHVLVLSRPNLRRILIDHDLVDAVPDDELPPDDTFDVAMHLTGATVADVVDRIAAAAGLDGPPADTNALSQAQWLRQRLRDLARRRRRTRRRFSLLVDALDEAQHPEHIAEQVLRPLTAIPGVRIVVGTRGSMDESPDAPLPDNTDLLTALGIGRNSRTAPRIVTVETDGLAVARYVERRLDAAVRAGRLTASRRDITAASGAIGANGRGFLFARLAVHELLARPHLLLPEGHHELAGLLDSDHYTLFASAVTRLRAQHPANSPLLTALALAQGRGLPIRDGVWASAASSLDEDLAPIADADIDRLITAAAPYIMLDSDCGQTVYRLAHRTFSEYFVRHTSSGSLGDDRHRRITARLAADAQLRAPDAVNRYLIAYLPYHASGGGTAGWLALARHPWVLDRIDPLAVATNAVQSPWRLAIPAEISGMIAAAGRLAATSLSDRTGVRQLAAARQAGAEPSSDSDAAIGDTTAWSIAWTSQLRASPHITLRGHANHVTALAPVALPNGQVLLASSGVDRTVRLWDPVAGRQLGPSLTGHTDTVNAVVALTLADGQVLLASGSADRTVRLWDLATGRQVGRPLTGHTDAVASLTTIALPDGQALLASSSDHPMAMNTAEWRFHKNRPDETVRLWDPTTGRCARVIRTGHGGPVGALTTMRQDGRRVLVTGGRDGTIRRWDPVDGSPVGDPVMTRLSQVRTLAVVTGPGERTCFAAVDYTNPSIHMVNMATGDMIGEVATDWGAIDSLVPFRYSDGRMLLASAGHNSTAVFLWDPALGESVGRLDCHGHSVLYTMCSLPTASGRTLLATGGHDGTVRVWFAPAQHTNTRGITPYGERGPTSVMAVPSDDGRQLIATAGGDSRVHVWDALSGKHDRALPTSFDGVSSMAVVRAAPERPLIVGVAASEVGVWDVTDFTWVGRFACPGGRITAAIGIPRPDGTDCLATGSSEGTIRLWDVVAGTQLTEEPLAGEDSAVREMVSVVSPDETCKLAIGDDRGVVRLLDPDQCKTITRCDLFGDVGAVGAMVLLKGSGDPVIAVAASRVVRLWDPFSGLPVGEPLTGHTADVTAVAVVPLGTERTLLATGSADGEIRVWNPLTAQPSLPPLPGANGVRALAAVQLTAGFTMLVCADDAGNIRLINPVSGILLGTIPLETDVRSSTVIGQDIALATSDGVVVVHLREPRRQLPVDEANAAIGDSADPLRSVPVARIPGLGRVRGALRRLAHALRAAPAATLEVLFPSAYSHKGVALDFPENRGRPVEHIPYIMRTNNKEKSQHSTELMRAWIISELALAFLAHPHWSWYVAVLVAVPEVAPVLDRFWRWPNEFTRGSR
jgi:WD40 repeat protein